ncbi:aminopeptidase P family protein [Bizionia argentinensis JUB59]|uniref:Aminopeptidase P family protein n=1 Tax=Bizionia argentinensis JUB59 TaxID=1046627 RepID=G2EGT2_9FLAO|nr:Xaa-Pro peptidase family protein [Bizionia argentinensis]EGV42314.1 aminopeptidase P family protein [Bizionia argentinensis JUB59]
MNSNRKYGIGGSKPEQELLKLSEPTKKPSPIDGKEFQSRIDKACESLKKKGLDALYINAGTNLQYFTNTLWNPSERLVGAILFADGTLKYVVPEFEIGTFNDFIGIDGELIPWAEHEWPVEKIAEVVPEGTHLAVDDSTAFTMISRFQENKKFTISSAEELIRDIRLLKSEAEIAHIQYPMNLTMQVHQAVARILKPGITTAEVESFIHKAHQKLGIASGSYFCIVLFGKDSSFPHGVKTPKPLEENDIVLVDTGCKFKGYLSDITRTYIYGDATDKEKKIWVNEKSAQLAAFHAAQLGKPCGHIDDQVRVQLEKDGLGPDYDLPGLPHRTGHGIGLEIHEHPFILRGNDLKLQVGMAFSIEPMIVVPDEFGVRLEDHIYMTEAGPKWFTEPAHSIENPFGV